MARTRRTQEKDVISRIADSGEDALRRLVDLPRRMVLQAVDDVDERLHDLATKVREIDPLYRRVAEIERRLDALEKTTKTTARRRPTRAKPSSAQSPVVDPQRTASEHEQGQTGAHAEGERAP